MGRLGKEEGIERIATERSTDDVGSFARIDRIVIFTPRRRSRLAGVLTSFMWSKGTMVLLWGVAVSSLVVAGTQSTARTWLVDAWVVACSLLAVLGTVMYRIGRHQRRRWDAGNYD